MDLSAGQDDNDDVDLPVDPRISGRVGWLAMLTSELVRWLSCPCVDALDAPEQPSIRSCWVAPLVRDGLF